MFMALIFCLGFILTFCRIGLNSHWMGQDDPEKSYMNHILVIKACSLHQERLSPDKKIWRLGAKFRISRDSGTSNST